MFDVLGVLLEANNATAAGRVLQSKDSGEPTSIPPNVDEGVCSLPLRHGLMAIAIHDSVGAAGLSSDGTSVLLHGTRTDFQRKLT